MSTRYKLGIDIGGTFTDAIAVSSDGALTIGKSPSTPPDFEQGFANAVEAVGERMGQEPTILWDRVDEIYHGCTVGTNALVEGRTARVGLLATRGHGDNLHHMQAGGRNRRLPPEDIAHVAAHEKPAPLVLRELVAEIHERTTFDGSELVALNEEHCRVEIKRLLDLGATAFAVSFLWSVVNPAHEHRARELIREASPDAYISLSSEVGKRTGEYERTVAAVVNSLIGPEMNGYLTKLEKLLAARGHRGALYVMTCSGGVVGVNEARSVPLLTIGSGPVAGLIGAGMLSRLATDSETRQTNVITADVGGTTFDVGVVRRGEPLRRSTSWHNQYEYTVPTLDVRSIGAGGGSLIRYDADRRTLRVGPQSAGAVPGPAAYGRGGTVATITDANLLLGILNPNYFLGGRITLDLDAARDALAAAGEPLGFTGEETAAAALRIVDSQMADAVRLASVQRGYDPRDHVLYAFGGGGAVHAAALARQLGINRVIVPLSDFAAGWSAFGTAAADVLLVEEMPHVMTAPFDPVALNETWVELETRALDRMAHQGVPRTGVTLERIVEMRYGAQTNQIEVVSPHEADERISEALVRAFEFEYARLFGEGTGYPAAGHVITAMRVTARAAVGDFTDLVPNSKARSAGLIPKKAERQVIFYERGPSRTTCSIYDGEAARPGMCCTGPAIIEFIDTTIVVRAQQHAFIDVRGSVIIAPLIEEFGSD
jgi:N-methylhydantoinase A